eukprot:Gregarina_sp_Pseudo_9__5806@NODE_878_length_2106_cov_3_408321_g638_i1_p4_GENE_NODE_878_length_2106_cov_3_408321_g638_i1NODE_878_length_2106_cov_3_408321_g638_i1_p4_ORF_typecomplete_len131_score24_90_NODE_878_length_2106_cov_3_408321_g638_i1271663
MAQLSRDSCRDAHCANSCCRRWRERTAAETETGDGTPARKGKLSSSLAARAREWPLAASSVNSRMVFTQWAHSVSPPKGSWLLQAAPSSLVYFSSGRCRPSDMPCHKLKYCEAQGPQGRRRCGSMLGDTA